MVESPADGMYHVTLDVNDQPASARSKLMYAVYDGGTKLTNGFFPASGPADIVFDHPAAKQGALTDFELKCGWDVNGDGSLDSSEIFCPLLITNTLGQVIGPPVVKGASTNLYDRCWFALLFATHFADTPHAAALLRVFMYGDAAGLDPGKRPTQTNTVSFNCFTDPFSVWLTHNAGAPFNSSGTAQIQYYVWGPNTSLADLVCRSYQFRSAAKAFYETNVLAAARTFFATNPVGTIATFPREGTSYSIPHVDESPSWVTNYLPGVTVTLSSTDRSDPSWSALTDDLFATIARGRFLSHTATYAVEKKIDTYGKKYLEVVRIHYTGVVEDLYDFSAEDQGAGGWAAIIQLGHGNGGYGSGRWSGVIFRDRIEFDQDAEKPFE